jgi:hypothetical protein
MAEYNTTYTNAVDLRALGGIVYRMVTGIVPFQVPAHLMEYHYGTYPFPKEPLSEITVRRASFIKQHLRPRRPSAPQALSHPRIPDEC